jgi:pimeloyl-ACP methyl ester carboxylesterase
MNEMSSRMSDGGRNALTPALDAPRREIHGRSGRLSFYAGGTGEPLLLVHSINAAGSAYEVKPIFERLTGSRRVYAVDLPGFGFSDRSKRDYRPRLYTDAIHDMLGAIAKDGNGDAPIDALAISLGSEFLARAAVERPDRFRSLTLVTPTGFSKGSQRLHGPRGETREIPGLHGFFTFPLWSQAIYSMLVSKPSIRYFLRKTFGSDNYDEGLAAYDYLTSHQPGAKNAPYAFVSGRLFSSDIRTVYEQLTLPIWMPHATKGDFADFSEAGWTSARPNWRVTPYDTGALPHFERPEQFMRDFSEFLATVKASQAVRTS